MESNFGNVFEPSVLRWAREKSEISLESLAIKLQDAWKHITPTLISQWEEGTVAPSPAQVKKLAEIYKRSVAVFLLANPPEENIPLPDRRTVGSKQINKFLPETLLMIRRARKVQLLAEELRGDLGIQRPFKYQKHDISENPVNLAVEIRKDLEIPIRDQFKSKKYSIFFDYLRKKIEGTGVIVLKSGGHNSFPTEDARAFSFTEKQPYVILINNQDTEGAKNFSLLHEFGHVLLQTAGICNNFALFNSVHDKNGMLEIFCNQFAANFLVPAEDLLTHRVLNGRNKILIDELDLVVNQLTKDFKVSRFVILRRLLNTGFIGSDAYKEKAKQWENEKPFRPKGGRTVPEKMAISKNGVSFSSLVLEAYKQNRLSHSTASDYLGIKNKYLPAVEKILNSYER